jgi:hypothetical protein
MKTKAINTVEQAIGFLETQELEAIQTDGGWILHGASFANGDFELTCDSDADLIDYARGERDLLLKSHSDGGVYPPSPLPDCSSCSPAVGFRGVQMDPATPAELVKNQKEEI